MTGNILASNLFSRSRQFLIRYTILDWGLRLALRLRHVWLTLVICEVALIDGCKPPQDAASAQHVFTPVTTADLPPDGKFAGDR